MKLPNLFTAKRIGVCLLLILVAISILLGLTHETMNSFKNLLPRSFHMVIEENGLLNPALPIKNITLADGEIFKFNSYIAMNVTNNVSVLKDDECYAGNIGSEMKMGRFALLSNFVWYQHKIYKSNLEFVGKSPTDEIIDARIMEIVDVIQANILHPYVQEIHILVSEQEGIDFLKRIDFQNAKKLVLKFTMGESVTLKIQLLYASKCFKNRIVAISNQDNKFGTGWDKFNPEILHRKKIMYALTRHSALSRCKGSTGSASCDPGYPYLGSHDTFIFDVRHGFTSEELIPMDKISANLSGMENVLIWMFKTKLGFTVLNPCPILKVNHQHCVPIRDKNRTRVNTRGKSGGAEFTNMLQTR